MSKGLAGALAAQLQVKLATEPFILVEVEWVNPNPLGLYADRDFESYQGKLLSVDNLEALTKLDTGGATVSMTMTLSDTDGLIKTIIDTADIHKTPVKVYQTDADLTGADKILVFDGEISSPISWSEHERSITFTVITKVESEEIGFSPEAGSLPFISEDAIGQAWPLCFGSPIRVPAAKITEAVRGTSLTKYGQLTISDLDDLCNAAGAEAVAEDAKTGVFGADFQQGFSDDNYGIVIENLTSATTDLINIFEELVSKSPSQQTNLLAYADNCKFLRRAEIDLVLYANIFVQATAAEAAADALLLDLQVQLLAAQSEVPIDVAKINDINAQIAAATVSKNTAAATVASANAEVLVQTSNIAVGEATKEAQEITLLAFTITEIIVEGGERFPQGVAVNIVINGMKFAGSFSGKVYTISTVNLPFYSSIPLGVRANSNPTEVFLADDSLDLKGKYLFFGNKLTYVESQDGTRLFINPILYSQTSALDPVPGVLVNGQPVVREVYTQDVISGGILEARVFVPKGWLDQIAGAGLPDYANGISNLRDQDYEINIGDDVYVDGDFQDKYVANLIPSTEIVEVIGRRDGELAVIPTRYYETNLSESIAGQTSTTITFKRPLPTYSDENWSDEVFVSLVSSEGPNTADVISYLLTTYSSLLPDAGTFASVNAAIAAYPSHFAILDRPDALTAIENIAWQARCAVTVRNGVASIKYLSAEETELFTLTVSNIKDLLITTQDTEELVTKFVAQWKSDYTLDEPKEVVLRNNVPKYGEQEQEYDFNIYNIESLVVKSATFWMIRLSNTWKRLEFTAFLDTLDADVYDTIEMDLSLVADAAVKGVVNKAAYNSDDNTIAYELELEVLFGDMEPHVFYWPSTAPAGITYPTAKDPYAGSS